MKKNVFFFLFTGLFHFTLTSHQLRTFNIHRGKRLRCKALEECSENKESLVTLYDEEDDIFADKFMINRGLWLGLRKSRNLTWSNGDNVNFNVSSVSLTDGEQMCEAIDNDTWKGYNCSLKKHFMCSKGTFQHI